MEEKTQFVTKKEVVKEEQIQEEEEEKWVMDYSSFHEILLVGEGDFSFSMCLAKSFGSASNIVASSLDTYDTLIKKYKQAKANLENLEKLGASLLHGVDATKMKLHTDLQMRKFDRIIFNFPHAGFHGKEDCHHLVKMHRNLVHGFLHNARGMLRAHGEIHVTHKTTAPFCYWNLPDLASRNSLELTKCVDFRIQDFPGYSNKRGDGPRCDEPFPLGECSTFKFIISPAAMKQSSVRNSASFHGKSRDLQVPPVHMQMQPISFSGQLGLNPPGHVRDMLGYDGLPLHVNIRHQCHRIFGGYLNHCAETFGRIDFKVVHSANEALNHGFERYMSEEPGASLSGYIDILEGLHHLSILRSRWLQNMLTGI